MSYYDSEAPSYADARCGGTGRLSALNSNRMKISRCTDLISDCAQFDQPTLGDASRLAYRVEDVATLLDVSPTTVRRLVARRKLVRVSGLRHLRIPRRSIDAFLRQAE